MYCSNCGREISDNTKICPKCGYNLNNDPLQTREQTREQKEKINATALVGFILSLVSIFLPLWGIVPICGLIFSIVGTKQCYSYSERGLGLAITGIVLCGIVLFVNWFAFKVVWVFF